METLHLWDNVPRMKEYEPVLEYYPAENKKTTATVVVFPGGGYMCRAEHEGKGYAEYLNSLGMDAFVCEYRVHEENLFPSPLLDARRAVRYVRYHAEKYGIDPDRIAVMGSSAGGHLAALVSTYTDAIEEEAGDAIDKMPYLPNATILCYPVIHHPDESDIAHWESYVFLVGENADFTKVSPDLLVNDSTPTAFIWHNSTDDGVNVINSYRYAEALRKHNIPCEMHIFSVGGHGQGLANGFFNVEQWPKLLENWFILREWLK